VYLVGLAVIPPIPPKYIEKSASFNGVAGVTPPLPWPRYLPHLLLLLLLSSSQAVFRMELDPFPPHIPGIHGKIERPSWRKCERVIFFFYWVTVITERYGERVLGIEWILRCVLSSCKEKKENQKHSK
jgi:hypothetical protein